ncbi:MAG: hypothetical protein HYV97_10210 [Bdellovibrio sp.]|nr:hypothetical protein [Bdellovibrio sp.]
MKVYKQKKVVGILIVAALSAQMLMTIGHAQDGLDGTGLEGDDVLASPQIDVDGTLNKKSEADRLAEMRKRMEKQHEEMVQKKIEDIRMKEEQRLGTKLRSAFNNSPASDEVSTAAAAPQKVEAQVQAPAPAPVEEDKPSFKIIPSYGVKNIAGDSIDLESKVNAQLGLEAMVSRRVSVGVSVGYTSLDMNSISQSPYGTAYNYNYNYSGSYNNFNNYYAPYYGTNYGFNNNFYNQNYYNAYGISGREMEYKQWSMEMNSKFFIVADGRIRPFIGLGVSYNRATLNYTEADPNASNYQWNGFTLGDEQFRTSYVGGSAILGTEVYFTKNFGLNMDVRYSRAITTGINNQSGNTFAYNPDQIKLEQIGKEIQETNSFSLSGGILLAF